jgi:hypothetical protein
MDSAISFDELRALSGGRPQVDAACPLCGPSRKTGAGRVRKVLRIWDDGDDFITFRCARCEEQGFAKDDARPRSESRPRPRPAPKAEPVEDKSATARFLWDRSQPASGSLVEVYLRSRGCGVASPNIRFLPGRDGYEPAMITRFGQDGPVTGIHLTKLRPDGTGKADVEKPKIMLGPSVGQPLVVKDNPEHPELVITEGIEDAASFALGRSWSAWAAGSWGRMAQIIPLTSGFERVFIAFDTDQARWNKTTVLADTPAYRDGGRVAFARCRELRPDIIGIDFSGLLGVKGLDANKVLQQFGAETLTAAIDVALLRSDLDQGSVTVREWNRRLTVVKQISAALANA